MFTSGKTSDLSCKEVVTALRSDILRAVSQLKPEIKLKASNTTNSYAVINAEGFNGELQLQRMLLMGPAAPVEGIIELQSGNSAANKFSGFKIVYANCHYTYKGMEGVIGSPLVKVEWGWSYPTLP